MGGTEDDFAGALAMAVPHNIIISLIIIKYNNLAYGNQWTRVQRV